MKRRLHYIAMDGSAAQAIEMAGLSPRSNKSQWAENKKRATLQADEMPIWVSTSQDIDGLANHLEADRRGLLLFPEPSEEKKIPEKLLKSPLHFVPVKLESLATFAFSQAIKSMELLFNEFHPDDFSLGSETYFADLPSGLFNRFHHVEGRHLKEAVLRIAHRVRSVQIKEGVAYTMRVPVNTPLFALDEAIDVLEIAVPPEKPIYFAIRFDPSPNSPVRITALAATPDHPTNELQAKIDAQPTYLGKLFVIIESFAFRKIDEEKMHQLCQENGLEPMDANRLYDYIYARSDETADLIKRLGQRSDRQVQEDEVAKKLAEGFLDIHILEELASLFALDANAILQKAEFYKKERFVNMR